MAIKTKRDKWLALAKHVSTNSTCIRRAYGAVIVKDDMLLGSGYNGAARGCTECSTVGECYRITNNIPHGQQYETCVSVHAEMNAIADAGWGKCKGATLYLAGFDVENGYDIEDPSCCIMCERFCKNAQLEFVVTESKVWRIKSGKFIEIDSIGLLAEALYTL